MYDWKSRFREQKEEFVQRSLQRLGAMEQLLETIEQRPNDVGLINDISQHFHQLAGSSAIYELDDVGRMAMQGEEIVMWWINGGQGVSAMDIHKLKNVTQSLRTMLRAQTTGQVTQECGAPQQAYESPVFAPPAQAKKVIVVDGDQSNLHHITRMLEQEGFEVRGYRTASGAKDALKGGLPDAMMLSLPLVDSPGYDVSQAMRSLPGGQTPPIIIMSRKTDFLDKVQSIRAGADAYFDDTADMAQIIKKMKLLMERDTPEQFKILHVEDDQDQINFVKSTLESVGYQVTSLMDPTLFEQVLLETDPDLILLDVMMGGVNGFELARFVRQHERYIATPIIFLTTQNQLNAHIESARVGGDDHLIKPIPPPLLIAACAGRLERYRFIKRLIGRDGLTSTLNVSLLMEKATSLIKDNQNQRFSSVLLLLDIDHMSSINDNFGWATGDKVLVSLANLLKRTFRQAEAIGRRGGDEFAVIVTDLEDHELAELATQVVRDFEGTSHSVGGQTLRATISAGASVLEYDMDLKSWFATAEVALKTARQQGGNCVMKAKPRGLREARHV